MNSNDVGDVHNIGDVHNVGDVHNIGDVHEEVRQRGSALYADLDAGDLPRTAVLASLGCGNPAEVADLREGEVVLDLGSGGGIDVLLSARRVGRTGRAYGLDMTEEMLALARRNATIDVVISITFTHEVADGLHGAIVAAVKPADAPSILPGAARSDAAPGCC